MLRPRIIPCLLVHDGGLVKTFGFMDPKYVGDPINAVRIFNEKEADELIVLDIDASVNSVEPNYRMISNLAAECRMPLCYGGGIKTAEQANRIISLGVEKIAISSAAVENTCLLTEIAEAVGRQSVVAVVDFKRKAGIFSKGYEIFVHNGKVKYAGDPLELLHRMQECGAGEIVVNSIDRDGLQKGYDLELAALIRRELKIPLTFLGGAGSHEDISNLFHKCGVVGAAAGSLFVFKGAYRAVLINYPTSHQKDELCRDGLKKNF